MPAQLSQPANRISTDIGEFESYLRQAAEFLGRHKPNAYGAPSARTKKGPWRDIFSRRGVTRRGVISRPKMF